MSDLFVSYARADSRAVDRLIRQLAAAGHRTWVDRSNLTGGEQWRQGIVAAVRAAGAVLLIVSPRSMASDNVRRELDIAVDAGARVIPVVLKPCAIPESFQYQLAGLQQVHLHPDWRRGVAELIAALGGRVAPPPARGASLLDGALFGLVVGLVLSLLVGNSDALWNLLTQDVWRALQAQEPDMLSLPADLGQMPRTETLVLLCTAGLLCGVGLRPRWGLTGGATVGLVLGAAWSALLLLPDLWAGVDATAQAASASRAVPAGIDPAATSLADAAAASTPGDAAATPAAIGPGTPPAQPPWWQTLVRLLFVGGIVGTLLGGVGTLLRRTRFAPLVGG